MGGRNEYLTKKVGHDEIERLDPLEMQRRITLLNQAPNIISNAIARGWISYPYRVENPKPKPDASKFVGNYDCLRAYQLRSTGMTIKDLCQFMKCSHGRIAAILRRGEEMAIQQRIDEVNANIIKRDKQQSTKALSNTKPQRNNTKRK